MASNQTRAFAFIPREWFEPVVGLWVVVLVSGTIQLALHGIGDLLWPYGEALWAAILVTVLVATIPYGGCISLTYAYRRYRNFESRLIVTSLDRTARRWLAGLVALAPALMFLGGLFATDDSISTELLGPGLPAYPAGLSGITLSFAGVNEMANQLPFVVFAALLAGLFMGPAMGALFHGVLQDTLDRVAPRGIVIIGTAAATVVLLGHADELSIAGGLVFAYALGVAAAYHETENLLVPMAAYGAFNAVALVLAWVDILASLYAHGHLFA